MVFNESPHELEILSFAVAASTESYRSPRPLLEDPSVASVVVLQMAVLTNLEDFPFLIKDEAIRAGAASDRPIAHHEGPPGPRGAGVESHADNGHYEAA